MQVGGSEGARAIAAIESSLAVFQHVAIPYAKGAAQPSLSAIQSAARQALDGIETLNVSVTLRSPAALQQLDVLSTTTESAAFLHSPARDISTMLGNILLSHKVEAGEVTSATVEARLGTLFSKSAETWTPQEVGEVFTYGQRGEELLPLWSRGVGDAGRAMRSAGSEAEYAKTAQQMNDTVRLWQTAHNPELTPERIERDVLSLMRKPKLSEKDATQLRLLLFHTPAGVAMKGPRSYYSELPMMLRQAEGNHPSADQRLRRYLSVWIGLRDRSERAQLVEGLRGIARDGHAATIADSHRLPLALPFLIEQTLRGTKGEARAKAAANLLRYAGDADTVRTLANTIARNARGTEFDAARPALRELQKLTKLNEYNTADLEAVRWAVTHAGEPRPTAATVAKRVDAIFERPVEDFDARDVAYLREALVGVPEESRISANVANLQSRSLLIDLRYLGVDTDKSVRNLSDLRRIWQTLRDPSFRNREASTDTLTRLLLQETRSRDDLMRMYDLLAFAPEKQQPLGPQFLGNGSTHLHMAILGTMQGDTRMGVWLDRYASIWGAQFDPDVQRRTMQEIGNMLDGAIPPTDRLQSVAFAGSLAASVDAVVAEATGLARVRRAAYAIPTEHRSMTSAQIRDRFVALAAALREAPIDANLREEALALVDKNIGRIDGTVDDGFADYIDHGDVGQLRSIADLAIALDHGGAPTW